MDWLLYIFFLNQKSDNQEINNKLIGQDNFDPLPDLLKLRVLHSICRFH